MSRIEQGSTVGLSGTVAPDQLPLRRGIRPWSELSPDEVKRCNQLRQSMRDLERLAMGVGVLGVSGAALTQVIPNNPDTPFWAFAGLGGGLAALAGGAALLRMSVHYSHMKTDYSASCTEVDLAWQALSAAKQSSAKSGGQVSPDVWRQVMSFGQEHPLLGAGVATAAALSATQKLGLFARMAAWLSAAGEAALASVPILFVKPSEENRGSVI